MYHTRAMPVSTGARPPKAVSVSLDFPPERYIKNIPELFVCIVHMYQIVQKLHTHGHVRQQRCPSQNTCAKNSARLRQHQRSCPHPRQSIVSVAPNTQQ